ncbi:hypothetical protein MJD09_11570 [bacterium]|nr:hypothetical protein [bacterium]
MWASPTGRRSWVNFYDSKLIFQKLGLGIPLSQVHGAAAPHQHHRLSFALLLKV